VSVMYKCVRRIHVLGVVLPVMYKCVRGIHVLGVVLPVKQAKLLLKHEYS
jgi:hypothetical protein